MAEVLGYLYGMRAQLAYLRLWVPAEFAWILLNTRDFRCGPSLDPQKHTTGHLAVDDHWAPSHEYSILSSR